ncbi:MAG TPA: PPOX class F420-dependent oxidoreductase [Baekduia sp.]|nr:PPOX class F420-dependent oxidoreductase [Baekduia sp.]
MDHDAAPPVRVPPELADLLERPLVAFLATTRPDGGLQCNPMWFSYDGSVIEMSHTSDRKKFRNLAQDPRLSLCIADPENLYRYIEVRGRLESTRPDGEAAFHRGLRVRYGMDPTHVPDADVRVVLAIRPTWIGGRHLADQSVQR